MLYSIVFGLAMLSSLLTLFDILSNKDSKKRFDDFTQGYINILTCVLWSVYHYMSN